MAKNPSIRLSGLARCLIGEGLLTQESAEEATKQSTNKKVPFSEYLVSNSIVKAIDMAMAASVAYGFPVFDLNAIDKEQVPKGKVSTKLVNKHHIVPMYERGKRLYIGVADPTNHQGFDEIKFHTGSSVSAILVEEDKLKSLIEFYTKEESAMDLEGVDLDGLEDINDDSGGGGGGDTVGADDEAPVVKFVNKILVDAINMGASDIHMEPYEKQFRIRYRQDGLLAEVASPPTSIASRVASRIKVMAQMNIAEKRVPQDGKIRLRLSKTHSVDFRANTCPTLYGEKIVLRILDAAGAQMGIEHLGFTDRQITDFMKAIESPYGMILVTGPTGSGKTVTLYTALNILNEPEINISTAEDPVEIQVAGINQVNVVERTGMTFAAALKAFLRQDPDIVMVGEIRDLETAEISIKAAQTGHLVLSTLHTNDAPQTLTRLSNMGVPVFNIASGVNLIMAQRLARRLCENCKTVEKDIPDQVLQDFGFKEEEIAAKPTIYQAVGCDRCKKGYKGRVGIFQVMPISEEMQRLIMDDGNSIELGDQALKEGIDDLRRSGVKKVIAGVTSLEELNRVTRE